MEWYDAPLNSENWTIGRCVNIIQNDEAPKLSGEADSVPGEEETSKKMCHLE